MKLSYEGVAFFIFHRYLLRLLLLLEEARDERE